jgi:aryl-alcohol dehydrogenase-like predicted oxidoreductase
MGNPELFEALNNLVKKGKLLNYGVSVEKAEEALKAIEYPGVKTVQIILIYLGINLRSYFLEKLKIAR